MHGQLRELVRRHDVTLLTLAHDDPAEWEAVRQLQAEGLRVHAVSRSTAGGWRGVIRRARLARRWARSRWPLRPLAFAVPEVQRRLDGLLREKTFDLIQVEDIVMGAYRYSTGAPMVLTEHEAVRDVQRSPFERAERARWRRFQVAAWGRFDRIQVFTEADAAAVRAGLPRCGGRVHVNPFGIHVGPEADPGRARPGSVVFVGGFHHPPNVDAALWLAKDILPRLRARTRGVHLTLIGDAPPRSVRALHSAGVTVTGAVPAVEPHLETAAVVVAPLRRGGGMRVKVLQAMAMGKAVVTTPLGAEGLLLEATPRPLEIAHTADDFAAATAALLRDAERRRELGRRARRFVEARHSWDAYGERLDALYAELTEPRAAPGRREP